MPPARILREPMSRVGPGGPAETNVAERKERLTITVDILLVCTANQCRSPMGEALLRDRLAARRVDARVASAGLLPGGAPATDAAITAMAAVGLDISRHVSRQVTPDLLEGVDLVVAMAREHAIEVTLMAPERWGRVFPLRDLVRRAEAQGPRLSGGGFHEWLAGVGEGRARSDLLGSLGRDDVDDPTGLGAATHRRTVHALDEQLTRLADLL